MDSLETNQFGTNEFLTWCRLVKTEPLLGFNLGTGSAEMAVAYVEYCNVDKGTKWSELRRSHGYESPHGVRYWCLGNEMDGPWQIGHLTAREYGRKARDAARQIRVIDPGLQLIACGSSNTILPTYLTWDREVLEECYDQVDGISPHNYYGNTPQLSGSRSARFLAMNSTWSARSSRSAQPATTCKACCAHRNACGSLSTNGTFGIALATSSL
jgi:alpha-N-arabinofuranosidase